MDKLLNTKLFLLDMDGTLLDSMEFWQNLGRQYLESKGKTPENNLEKIIESMTLKESASYFKTKYRNHNLDRAKNQFQLCRQIDLKRNEMNKIVNESF